MTEPYLPQTDEDYYRWRELNSGGFVLNVEASLSPSSAVLHRADCPHIRSHRNPGAFTERDYRKVCASDIEVLRAWVRDQAAGSGGFDRDCPVCNPR